MSRLFTCPLADGKIDSEFCLEIQECVDGITACNCLKFVLDIGTTIWGLILSNQVRR